jgi:hypothetical protein
MNFKNLEETLPNGFHDGRLKSLSIDYVSRTLNMDMDLCTGNPEAKAEKERESYRSATVIVENLEFCIIDPPASGYPFNKARQLTIDAGPGAPPNDSVKIPNIGTSSFLFWIWVNEWNAFIRIAAEGIKIEWIS